MNTELTLFSDKNVIYTGVTSPTIGVTQGDSLHEVLNRLVLELTHVIQRVNACSFCQEDGEINPLDASNIATSATMQNSTLTSYGLVVVKTTPNATGVAVTIDLDGVVNGLGEGTTVLKTKTVIEGLKNGFPSRIVDSNKPTMSIVLKPENFPATLDAEIRYQDAQGEKVLNLRVPITSIASEIHLPMQGTFSGIPHVTNQEQLNQTIQARLLNVENVVSHLNNINISGFNLPTNTKLGEALAYILSEIESIKSQLP